MSNDTQVQAHTALAKECGAITYTHRSNPHEAAVSFGPMAWEKFVEASARQLAEQPGFVMVERGALHMVVNALRRDAEEGRSVRGEMADMLLTAPPTAPSTEASEPVGEREAFEAHWYDFYHAGSIQADADGTYWPKEVQCAWQAWQAARTTPPPAPVLSDAEIDAITVAQWGDRVVTAAYRAYARAIEQAIGRASRGAK